MHTALHKNSHIQLRMHITDPLHVNLLDFSIKGRQESCEFSGFQSETQRAAKKKKTLRSKSIHERKEQITRIKKHFCVSAVTQTQVQKKQILLFSAHLKFGLSGCRNKFHNDGDKKKNLSCCAYIGFQKSSLRVTFLKTFDCLNVVKAGGNTSRASLKHNIATPTHRLIRNSIG